MLVRWNKNTCSGSQDCFEAKLAMIPFILCMHYYRLSVTQPFQAQELGEGELNVRRRSWNIPGPDVDDS